MEKLDYYSAHCGKRRRRRHSSSSSEESNRESIRDAPYKSKKYHYMSRRHRRRRRRTRDRVPPLPVRPVLSKKRKGGEMDEEAQQHRRNSPPNSSTPATTTSSTFPLRGREQLAPSKNFYYSACSPLSMDSGYGSLPSNTTTECRSLFVENVFIAEEDDEEAEAEAEQERAEEDVEEDNLFLCPNCGVFRRNDHCVCREEEGSVGTDRRIEPFGQGTSKSRTIGVVEPIVVHKGLASTSKSFNRKASPKIFRKEKYGKRRNKYCKSSETSSDVDGDLDSYSSSEEDEKYNEHSVDKTSYSSPSLAKDKSKHRQVVSPSYLNSSVVLSSQITSIPHEELDKKLLSSLPIEEASSYTTELHIEDFRKTSQNSNNTSATTDILQASISSLFDEPIPHVDDLLTNIDLQPIGGEEQVPSSKDPPRSLEPQRKTTTLFKNENKEFDDWVYCQEKGCGFWTRKTSRMERHISCHLPDAKYYKCPDCPLRFYSLAKMLRHDRRLHTGVKEYECRVCDAEVTDIQIHMRVHREEKQFECHMCPMQFRHKNSLVRHLCQHTGERPYPCSQCDSAFVSLHRLKEHNKRHHEKSDKPPTKKKKPSSSGGISSSTFIYNQTENTTSLQSTFPTLYSISTSSQTQTVSPQQQQSSSLLFLADTSKTGLLGNSTLYIASPIINPQVLWQTTNNSTSPVFLHTPSLESSTTSITTSTSLMKSQVRGGPFSCKDCGRAYKLETFLIAHRKNCCRKI